MEPTRRDVLAAGLLLAGLRAPELDIPFVPTPHALVEAMLDLARVGPGDYLIDLGCGDGRIAIAAARPGAPAPAAPGRWESTSIRSGSRRRPPRPGSPESRPTFDSAARICSRPRSTKPAWSRSTCCRESTSRFARAF